MIKKTLIQAGKMLAMIVMMLIMGFTLLGVFAFSPEMPVLFYVIWGTCLLISILFSAYMDVKYGG